MTDRFLIAMIWIQGAACATLIAAVAYFAFVVFTDPANALRAPCVKAGCTIVTHTHSHHHHPAS